MITQYPEPDVVEFHLTKEEADCIFDPFDPNDHDMPSHLHHRGHRYIKDDVYQWMIENVGQAPFQWTTFTGPWGCKVIIWGEDKAALFKLAWA